MGTLEINGTISVKVTPADILKNQKENPTSLIGFTDYLKAVSAALNFQMIKVLNNQLHENDHCLHYTSCHPIKDGDLIVCFIIEKRSSFYGGKDAPA